MGRELKLGFDYLNEYRKCLIENNLEVAGGAVKNCLEQLSCRLLCGGPKVVYFVPNTAITVK